MLAEVGARGGAPANVHRNAHGVRGAAAILAHRGVCHVCGALGGAPACELVHRQLLRGCDGLELRHRHGVCARHALRPSIRLQIVPHARNLHAVRNLCLVPGVHPNFSRLVEHRLPARLFRSRP